MQEEREHALLNFPYSSYDMEEILKNPPIEQRKKSSRYRGVSWRSDTGNWIVQLKLDQWAHKYGRYEFEEQAARVFDKLLLRECGPVRPF